MKSKRICQISRRNSLLNHVNDRKTQGRIDVTGRRGIRGKQLLNDVKEIRGYWKLNEEELDLTVWRIRFGRPLWSCRKTDFG
jgi:hypothetical protein